MLCDSRNTTILGCQPDKTPVVSTAVVPTIHCSSHQAPRGFKYVNQGGVCVMVQTSTGRVITQINPGYAPPILAVQPVIAMSGDIVASAGNWIANNKGLALGIALGVAWLISKNK